MLSTRCRQVVRRYRYCIAFHMPLCYRLNNLYRMIHSLLEAQRVWCGCLFILLCAEWAYFASISMSLNDQVFFVLSVCALDLERFKQRQFYELDQHGRSDWQHWYRRKWRWHKANRDPEKGQLLAWSSKMKSLKVVKSRGLQTNDCWSRGDSPCDGAS